jgi:DNA-binding GntR family transcriptional regulator
MAELNYTTLREEVAMILRKRILDGTIPPGEKIREVEVAKEFNISRGPVREALRQIEQEGFVHYEPNKGCKVVTMSLDNMNEMYLIRSTLEKLAVRIYDGNFRESTLEKMQEQVDLIGKAAEERKLSAIVACDEAFHQLIVAEAASRRLLRTWKNFEGENAAIYYTMNRYGLMPMDYLKRNHQWIVDVCRERDCEKICKCVERHYMVVPEDLHKKMEEEKNSGEAL